MQWLALCLLCSSICSVLSQLVVLQPPDLAAEFPNGHIEGSTAVFGTPEYGKRIAGKLLFFDKPGCEEDDYHIDVPELVDDEEGSARRRRLYTTGKEEGGGVSADNLSRRLQGEEGGEQQQQQHRAQDLKTVVMVRRGECHFVTKVSIAEKKGATAVIIVDSVGSMTHANDVKKIIMADDGWGDHVVIPSLLIGEIDGLKLINKLNKGERVIVELAWSVPQATTVQMDQWMSPAFTDTNNFLKEFATYAKTLKHKLDYHPHYVVITLGRDFKEMCTDEEGKFCGWDPDKGGRTTGKEIMEETVRQLCLWEITQKLNQTDADSGFYSEEWWSYVERVTDECPHKGSVDKDLKASLLLDMTEQEYDDKHTLSENCSYGLMEKVKANVNQVKKCYAHEFNNLLTRELVNKAWSSTAVMINSWRYSGPLEAEQLSRTLCTGYEKEPEECLSLFHPSRNQLIRDGMLLERVEGMALWSVVLVSVIAIIIGMFLAAILYWYCIHPRIRSSMRYSIMDEVRKNPPNNSSGGHLYDVQPKSGASTELPSASQSQSSFSNVCGIAVGAEPVGRQFAYEIESGGGAASNQEQDVIKIGIGK
eukprot:GHVS01085709.1.p1 GENE.GHVS01085709.1~~GHVS01085709.1.p1  ORF type:complete len:591 (+),score=86.08 GHVS01085709.1:201-1973(+)